MKTGNPDGHANWIQAERELHEEAVGRCQARQLLQNEIRASESQCGVVQAKKTDLEEIRGALEAQKTDLEEELHTHI